MLRRVIILILFLCATHLPAGKAAGINDVYVIHFVLDGTNKRVFDEVLEEGRMPNVKKLFIENGANFTHALSAFPTTSTTIYQGFSSGLLPGNSGIPHLERFDRESQRIIGYLTAKDYLTINSDFSNFKTSTKTPSTIFELLDGYPTLSLYSSFRRGASLAFPKRFPVHALWSTYVSESAQKVDVLAYNKIMKIFGGKYLPRYSVVGLYSTDISGHKYGATSEEVKYALMQFDYFIKEFWEMLNKIGIAEKTYIIVSADHAMHDTGSCFDIGEALIKAGVYVKPKNPKIKDYTVYVADRGISSTHIYVKHDGGWEPVDDISIFRKHPKIGGGTIDLIGAILNMEPTELLIARNGAYSSHIFDTDGGEGVVKCELRDNKDWCSYKIVSDKKDPLHYSDNPKLTRLLDGKMHSMYEWRVATANEHYPDAVVQLTQIFHDGRAGDIFVIPKHGWGFKKEKVATHGSILDDDMRIPMLMKGPTVPVGTFDVMQIMDVYPLLLEWFGLKVPAQNYDGINPFKNYTINDR